MAMIIIQGESSSDSPMYEVEAGVEVTLSSSTTGAWELQGTPRGPNEESSAATLSGTTGVSVTITPDLAGSYCGQHTASDGTVTLWGFHVGDAPSASNPREPCAGETTHFGGWSLELIRAMRLAAAGGVTDWVEFTPQIQMTTTDITVGNGTLTGYYRLVGQNIEIRGNLLIGSETTIPAGNWTFFGPPGFEDDDTIDLYDAVGVGILHNPGSALYACTAHIVPGTGVPVRIRLIYADEQVEENVPFLFAEGDRITWRASIPVTAYEDAS